MSKPRIRGTTVIFLVLGGFWILFLVSAHLILDLEEGNDYFRSLRSSKFDQRLNNIKDAEGILKFKSVEVHQQGEDARDEALKFCEIPEDKTYPDCGNRVEWLRENWKSDPCYKEYDVDGSNCSIIIYLSEVESWCPRLPWREYMKRQQRKREKAIMRTTVSDALFNLKLIPGAQPIISRILGMRSSWQEDLRFMQRKQQQIDQRRKRKIIVFISSLPRSRQKGSLFSDDLLQWSDLLASLYILGHDVTVMTETVELLSLLTEGSQFIHSGCRKRNPEVDLVYIDIRGLQRLVTSLPDARMRSLLWSKYSCRFRVLAPFGMDAEFNYRDFKGTLMGERSQSGNWNLNLRQFLAKYPLSVDNSFLGFALGNHQKRKRYKKTSMAFVYGKPAELKAHESFLKTIRKRMRIHSAMSTAGEDVGLKFIVNHAHLNMSSLRRLLRKSKLFIGLGSPLEEALPLYAIAQGCVFINPKFTRHQNRLNSRALKDQPSSRKFGSQHPYAETFIGRPWVYTINITNKTEVETTLTEILKQKVQLYIPFEFSCEGMLERLNAYIENQDFCDKNHQWPLQRDELEIVIGKVGETCTETCFGEGLTCGPEYFHLLNSSVVASCKEVDSEESLIAPAIEEYSSHCVFQRQPLLYSCAGYDPYYKRFCPCTLYRKGQIALCKSCVQSDERHKPSIENTTLSR